MSADLVPAEFQSSIPACRVIAGKLCGVQGFLFTVSLLVNLRFDGLTYDYDARYCYPNGADAFIALVSWDGVGDPPGAWAKEKVSGRLGPALLDGEEA